MGKTLIKIDCVDQRLIITSAPTLASGGKNEDEVEFNFCSKWDGFEKVGVFYRDIKDPHKATIDPTGRCAIPWEVLTSDGYIFIGAFGVKDDITRTTEILKYKVRLGAITEDLKPSDPTPELWEQILARVADKVNVKQGVEHAGKVLGIDEEGNVTPVIGGSGAILDPTLSEENQAAEAKAVGEALAKKVDTKNFNAFEKNRPFDLTGNPVQVETFEGMPLNPVTVLEPKQSGSGDPSPDNIRPFIGWDKLDLHAAGKNLLSLKNLTNTVADNVNVAFYDNEISISPKAGGIGFQQWYGKMTVPESWRGKTFTYSVQSSVNGSSASVQPKSFLIENDANGNEIGIAANLTVTPGVASSGSFVVKENTVSFTILFRADQNQMFPTGAHMWFGRIQLEEGSAVTAYEPYQGNAYTLNIDQTVYGIRHEWLTGRSWIEWVMKTLNGTGGFEHFSVAEGELFRTTLSDAYSEMDIISDTYATVPKNQRRDFGLYANPAISGLDIIDSRFASVDAFKANLAQNPVHIVYKLATPVEIQLEPHEILALQGVNTLYGDGEITISGRSDMQAVVSNLLKRIATLESKLNESTLSDESE